MISFVKEEHGASLMIVGTWFLRKVCLYKFDRGAKFFCVVTHQDTQGAATQGVFERQYFQSWIFEELEFSLDTEVTPEVLLHNGALSPFPKIEMQNDKKRSVLILVEKN